MFVVNDDEQSWYLKGWFDYDGRRHTLWTSNRQGAMDYYDRKAAKSMVKKLQENGYKDVRIVE